MSTPPGSESADVVHGVQQRRERLLDCMAALESAIAAPAPSREDVWGKGLLDQLDVLSSVFAEHVAEAEAPGAFLDRAVEEEPRLHSAGQRLRDDHPEIAAHIERLCDQVRASSGDASAPTALRDEVMELLKKLARHRQRGADLLYEAYQVDISAGD